MSLNIKTSTRLERIHSVQIKGEGLPVTFVKGIKSVGNSVIITDFVPAYDWIMFADIKLGAALSPSLAWKYIIGAGYAPGDSTTGFYAAELSNTGNNIAYGTFQGNAYGDSGVCSTVITNSDAISARNTLTMRRGNAGSQFGMAAVINATSATRTDIHTTVAISGLHSYNPTENIYAYNAREITFYHVTFCDNAGTTLHDLIPAKSKTTNKAGLYDVVTGKFYQSHMNFDDFIMEV